MALLSDRAGFDRMAGIRCQAAIKSQGEPFTIEDACCEAELIMPVSGDDLRTFINICDTWGIRVNVDQEPFWKAYLTI